MSLLDVFTDSDSVVQTWDDYCDMVDGVEACQDGRECPEGASVAFMYGWQQEHYRQEAFSAIQ